MSFDDQVQLKKKTDKLFGLDQQDYSLRPQKSGWLIKKPFTKRLGFTSPKISRKRWFAVKDSFIFWYDSESKMEEGVSKPKGAIPLGGAMVRLLPDKISVELRHPCFTRAEVLVLKAADPFEADEWISVIKAGMQATWENSMLGFAMIEKLKNKGTSLESDKDDALAKAQVEAQRLDYERTEMQKLHDRKMQMTQVQEAESAVVANKVGELKKQASLKEDEHIKEKESYEMEKKKREKLEREFMDAQEALMEIEAAFEAFDNERLRLAALERKQNEFNQLEFRKRAPSIKPEAMVPVTVTHLIPDKFIDEAKVRKNVLKLKEYFEAISRTNELRRKILKINV